MEEKLEALWAEARDLNLGTTPEIDRLPSAPSPLQFLRDYASPNKPCIISSSSTSHWPAISLWSSDSYLCGALLHHPVSLHLTPSGRADSLAPHPLLPLLRLRRRPLRPLPHRPPPHLLLLLLLLPRLLRPAAERLLPLRVLPPRRRRRAPHPVGHRRLRRGPTRRRQPLDRQLPLHHLFPQGPLRESLRRDTGEKHFLLLPPTEVHRLYVRRYPAAVYREDDECGGGLRLEMEEPEREVPWCSVDPYPDSMQELERQRSEFPMYFDGPEPFRCTVRAGEILYLPSMWFHHVRQSPDENGRAIAVNYWYDMKFDIKYAFFNFLESISVDDSGVDADDSETESER